MTRRVASSTTETQLRPTLTDALIVCTVLAILYLLPAFRPDRSLGGTDYSGAGFMMTEFLSRAIASGHLPRWVPDILGGLPLFANPGSAFQPVRLVLSLVLPIQYVLPALFAIYFAVAGVGMYVLLRELDVRPWVALALGIAYEFTGTISSLIYAGHDGRFIVAASAPLVLFALHRGLRTGSIGAFVGAGVVLGFALLSFQLQSTYYLLLAGGLWSLFVIATHRLRGRALVARSALAIGAVVVAFAMSAINLLPFAGYVEASPRAASVGRGYDFATQFSMPPEETLGMAVPEQAGMLEAYHGPNPLKLHTEYAGALVLTLAVLSLCFVIRDRRWLFFAGLATLGLTIAWGKFTPVYHLYYKVLPGTTKFRAPSIALFVVILAMVVIAALALERLSVLREGKQAERRQAVRRMVRVLGVLVVVVVVSALTQSVSGPAGAAAAAGWLRFTAVLALTGGVLLLWLDERLSTRVAAVVLGAGAFVDLGVVNHRFLLMVDTPDMLYASDNVVDYLRGRTDVGRVWVFPKAMPNDSGGYVGNGHFGLHTNYFMHFGIAQLGGEHGNQLQRWNEYIGVDPTSQIIDWRNMIESMPMLSAAGVRYAIARTDLTLTRTRDGKVTPSGFERVFDGRATVFRNDSALPRAYRVPAVEIASRQGSAIAMMRRDSWNPRLTAIVERRITGVPIATPGALSPPSGTTKLTLDTPDSVAVMTTGPAPAMLVLADNYYPSWTATIDGVPAEIHRVNHTFRGVAVPAGEHTVSFAFRPPSLYAGLWISLAIALGMSIYGLAQLVRLVALRRVTPRLFAPVRGTAA
jgi:hypothetical protein